ncbi:hypothetical protein PROFUN_05694 [Planoprotostelium fungivorum]|uniref:Uncharacterized protein n=1 Tax=Planoprotostelium fungivorum TaxID=1890364 RepID=A0A2P6NQJ1_9EUKA|nr:hypothetical protein PROFUN_05694 [Planoprotostelium fungivorum]
MTKMMWVGSGLTSWFHRVPTVMTRGACLILGRVAGQFSHFFQVERHMAYTVCMYAKYWRNMHFDQVGHRFRDQCDIPLESARLRESGSEQHLAYPGVVSVSTSDRLAYKWLYLSWERLLPLFSFTVVISASVRVRMMYAGVSDPHLPKCVICTLLKLGIVFVTSVIYHWNQRISESQDQNNTWPTQEWYLFPPPTVCIRDECKLR